MKQEIDERLEKRLKEVKELDMFLDIADNSFYGKSDVNKDFNIHLFEIQFDSEKVWNEKISSLKNEYKRRIENN